MKLSFSNIGWDAPLDEKMYQQMKTLGYSGLEIAPTRIFPTNPYENLQNARDWYQKLKKEYGFVIPSMQSIWYGKQERIFGSSEDRQILIDYTKRAIDFAQVIECRNLVFGCPRNRNLLEGDNRETAIDFFREIGEYAYFHGTVIGMEANPPIYNTNYINDTQAAIDLITEVNNRGFLLNLDLGTMIENGETIGILEGNAHLINHVHISEPGLKRIQKRKLQEELATFLKACGYQGFVSIEMAKGSELAILVEDMTYIKEVFGS